MATRTWLLLRDNSPVGELSYSKTVVKGEGAYEAVKCKPTDPRPIQFFDAVEEAEEWALDGHTGGVTRIYYKPVPREMLSLLRAASDDGIVEAHGNRERGARIGLLKAGLCDADSRITEAGTIAVASGLMLVR